MNTSTPPHPQDDKSVSDLGITETAAGQPESQGSTKGRIWTILRVAIGAGLLGYVFWTTDWGEFAGVLRQTDYRFLAISMVMTPALVAVSVWKWRMLLVPFRIRASFNRLFLLYLVGNFFNNVLPSNVGGDVVRAASLARSSERHAEAVTSVFMERYTGLTVLILMALASVPLNLALSSDPRFLGAVAIVCAGYVVLLFAVLTPGYMEWLSQRNLPPLVSKVVRKALSFQRAVAQYRNHKMTLGRALLNSFLWNLVAVLNVYFSALAFGHHISLWTLIITVPLILTVTMMPLTFGGIGLAEWAYMFAFTQIGAGAALGLSVALLIRFKTILFGSLGALIYASGSATVNTRTADSSQTVVPRVKKV